MSRPAIRDLCAAKIAEADRDSSSRFVHLRLIIDSDDGEELSVGGIWDRRLKRYIAGEESPRARIFRVHGAQVEAVRWIKKWFGSKVRGETYREPDATGRRYAKWSVLWSGGRRAGKTWLGVVVAIAMALLVPRTRVWLVSPSFPETEELELELRTMIPSSWIVGKPLGAPWYTRKLVNGSTITFRSAHDPKDLKRGRCDFAVFNEAQKIDKDGFAQVRGAIADRAGLVILCANPPDSGIGLWVQDLFERIEEGKAPTSTKHHFDNRLNPHSNQEALEDMLGEVVDERTFAREVRGEFLARTDVVFYEFHKDNVQEIPASGERSVEFLASHHGAELQFEVAIGADFQRTPHMAATVWRMFDDPDDPGGMPIFWIVDEIIVEQGDEDDLIDALEMRGYGQQPGKVKAVVIGDASGEWQDADRTRGRGSFDVFRRRGWIHIYQPDVNAKRNPLVEDRIAVGNAMLCSRKTERNPNGKRHVRIAPHCTQTILSLKMWEIRDGRAYRKSKWAHVGDAVTYPLWRWFPRKHIVVGDKPFESVKLTRSRRAGFDPHDED